MRVVVSSWTREYPVASRASVMEIGDGVAREAMVRSISPIRRVAKGVIGHESAGRHNSAAIEVRVAGRVRDEY